MLILLIFINIIIIKYTELFDSIIMNIKTKYDTKETSFINYTYIIINNMNHY